MRYVFALLTNRADIDCDKNNATVLENSGDHYALNRFQRPTRNGRRNWGSLSALIGCLFVLCLALIALPANAQYGASIQGTVADAQGSMIPGAHITLVEKDTNRKAEANADGAGNFFFGGLAPSVYTVTISHDGFKTKVIDNYKVVADQANGVNVKLEVGGATTTVTVNANDQALIDTETGSIGTTISKQDVANLPSFGRDVFQIIQLAPGMFGDGSRSSGGNTSVLPGSQDGAPGAANGIFTTENVPQVQANGGRTDTNAITIDGVTVTSVTWGGAAVITPNEDTVKELKVVSNPYDAEEGRTSGGSIHITSQNGTNNYHGTGFFKVDRAGLNAAPRWDPQDALADKNTARFNQFGGTVGGPILHNHLFAFFGYETIRNTSPGISTGWYDTAAFEGLTGNAGPIAKAYLSDPGNAPTYKTAKQIDQDCGATSNVGLTQGWNCNYIQGSGLAVGKPATYPGGYGTPDPAFFGQLNGPGGTAFYAAGLGGDGSTVDAPAAWGNPVGQQIANPANIGDTASLVFLQTSTPSSNINVQYNGRVDWQATSKDLIAATVYDVPVTNTSYSNARGYSLFHHDALNWSLGALWDHTFNSNLINQARADYAGWLWNEILDNPDMPYGLPDDNISNSVIVSSPSATNTLGNPYHGANPNGFGPSIGSVFDQWTLNFKDVTTWAHKTHNIKFGGNVTRLAYLDDITWGGGFVPTYNFNNMWDFLNDAPNSENGTFNPVTGNLNPFRKDDRQMYYGFFAQDDWKVKPNLTVNLGLRWEYFPAMFDKQNDVANVRLGTGANILTDLSIQIGGSEWTAQKGNFAPQLGFAWSPLRNNGKIVIHGGFGIGFNGLEMAVSTNNRFNPPLVDNGVNLLPASVVGVNNPHLEYVQGSGGVNKANQFPANTSVISTPNSANLYANSTMGVTGAPSNYQTPYVYRYSLDGQYDLGHSWVATVGYQGSAGRHLPIVANLLNLLAPQLISGQIAPNPLVNGIDWQYPGGKSSFNALLAELRHQMSHGFELDAQYRWAKSLDDGSQSNAPTDYQFLPGYNYGPSAFDSRQMFKVYGLWAPTIFKGQNNMYEKLLGSWNIGGIMNFHSGFPLNPMWYGLDSSAVYTGSSNNSGNLNLNNTQGDLRGSAYSGGAGMSQSTDVFKKGNGNFSKGGQSYFAKQTVVTGPNWNTSAGPQGPFTAIPAAPGYGRNAFPGPHYFDIDMSITKAFVLPKMKVLGDNARLEIRANAFNVFNKLNLNNNGIDQNISDTKFGQDTNVNGQGSGVMAGRNVELEAHFKF